jgi:hypothetical protein
MMRGGDGGAACWTVGSSLFVSFGGSFLMTLAPIVSIWANPGACVTNLQDVDDYYGCR